MGRDGKLNSGVVLRFKALFFDWLFICAYLAALLVVASVFYFLVLDGVPEFTPLQTQLIAALTSTLPVTIIFSILEGRGEFASWGKGKVNLEVSYIGKPIQGAIMRNIFKFLPWQFGHMSTINGMYNGFETPFSIVFLVLSMVLPILLVMMVVIRKDNRHLGDILAGSRVVHKQST